MIGPVVVVDEAVRRAMEAVEKSKTYCMIVMPMAIPDPPEAGGVMAAPEDGKRKPHRNAGIVARKATRRASVGRRTLIRTRPDQAEETQEGVKSRTTRMALNEPKMERTLPS